MSGFAVSLGAIVGHILPLSCVVLGAGESLHDGCIEGLVCFQQWFIDCFVFSIESDPLRIVKVSLSLSTPKVEAVPGEQEKFIDELKKVTSCNRCGAIGHWEEDCSQPARGRKKRSTLQRAKEKVVGSGERNLTARDEEVHRTTRLWRSTTMVRKIKRHI